MHEPSEERKYKCQFCPFYVTTKNGVVQHQKLHLKKNDKGKEDASYSCSKCPYKTTYPQEIKKHLLHHDPIDEEWTVKCKYCSYSAASRNGLIRHVTLHPEYYKDKMNSEAKEDSDNEELQNDYEMEDVSYGETTEHATANHCSICPFTGPPSKVRRHMKMHTPSEERQAKCPHCNFYVERSASLGSHIQLHIAKKETSKVKGTEDDESCEKFVESDIENESSDDSEGEPENDDETKSKTKAKVSKYQCSSCPYVARRPELEIHILGHKPNPRNIYQCSLCSYASSNKASLNMHNKVHQPDYITTQVAHYKVHFDRNYMGECPPASPAKSDISDVSDCDVLEMANIKQQLITAKIISAPVSRNRFEPETGKRVNDDCVMEGLFVDKNGDMKMGLFRTMIRCRHCPYAHIQAEELQRHELMHERKSGKYSCCYCSYKCDHKALQSRHMRVHAHQYVPGAREINDYRCQSDEETDEEDDEVDVEVSFKEPPASEEDQPDVEKSNNRDVKLPKAAMKSPDGNSIKIKSKPLLSINDMPPGVEYYMRQDKATGDNFLERASVKKWCCEKCPYASMDKDRFENHAMLHASHQRNVCEFCDYSVPVYNFLLEHRKLHLKPNPNLLAMQSVSNLLSLPEVPADVAAAANFPGNTDDPISQFGTHDHMDLYENSDQYTEPRKLYHCDRCPYTNVRRDNLLSHLRLHMIRSELKCDYCDYSVGKHELLVQHVRVHFVDPSAIKLDQNSNPIVSTARRESPAMKPVLKDTANLSVNTKSSILKKSNENKLKRDRAAPKKDEVEDLNNNSSDWICQYCDRVFNESDRLLRHEMQHLIGQRV